MLEALTAVFVGIKSLVKSFNKRLPAGFSGVLPLKRQSCAVFPEKFDQSNYVSKSWKLTVYF